VATAIVGQKTEDAPAFDELDVLAAAAPTMTGAEYITASVLETLWAEIAGAFRSERGEAKGSVQGLSRNTRRVVRP
jgi:hypothetical protein